MMKIALSVLLAGAAASNVASGVIDYRWGMTASEVATHSGGKAPIGQSAAWAMGRPYTLGNVGTAMLFGEEMEAGFYYIEDGLVQVRMLKRAPCPAMRETLKARLGDPVQESDYPSGYSATWLDAASGTEIRHFASGDCKVFFIKKD